LNERVNQCFFAYIFFHKICFCQLLSIECQRVTKRKCIYHFQSVTWSSILLTDKSFILYFFLFMSILFFFSLKTVCDQVNQWQLVRNIIIEQLTTTILWTKRKITHENFCRHLDSIVTIITSDFFCIFVARNSPVYRN